MTHFLHLTPLGSKNGIFTPLTPKTEKFDPLPIFVSKLDVIFTAEKVSFRVPFFLCIENEESNLSRPPPKYNGFNTKLLYFFIQ